MEATTTHRLTIALIIITYIPIEKIKISSPKRNLAHINIPTYPSKTIACTSAQKKLTPYFFPPASQPQKIPHSSNDKQSRKMTNSMVNIKLR